MDLRIRKAVLNEGCRIELPSSKSVSNRLLLIKALSGSDSQIFNLSDSDDTALMQVALSAEGEVDAANAGTVSRFMLSYLALRGKQTILRGDESRPIGILVDKLSSLGASIEYCGNEGNLPVRIYPSTLSGGKLSVEAQVSSQFISSLMMIGPYLEGGLEIQLSGTVYSRPYIDMTLDLMKESGAEVSASDSVIRISQGGYRMPVFTVPADWSAASYWYETVAITGGRVFLQHLKTGSLQGDERIIQIFEQLGVRTSNQRDGILIEGGGDCVGDLELDCKDIPDMVQTLTSTMCALGVKFRIEGVRNLRLKETDRLSALRVELGKLGYRLHVENDCISWNGEKVVKTSDIIETHSDHRMAMSMAPLAFTEGELTVRDADVVRKSYPRYWKDLRQYGFEILTLS